MTCQIRFIPVLLLLIQCMFAGDIDLTGMLLTTKPAPQPGLSQSSFVPVSYQHCRLPLSGEGYYSLEGTIFIDPQLKDPALYIGSTIYPFDLYVGGVLLYRWGTGGKSNQMADYRSHSAAIYPGLKGIQNFRIDFWTNGESMTLPVFKIGERLQMENMAARISFFNVHLLNGVLVSAILIAILFLGIFVISGKKEPQILYFVLLSLSLVLSLNIFPLNTQEIPEVFIFKISRIAMLFVPFFMLQFVRAQTGAFTQKTIFFNLPLSAIGIIGTLIAVSNDGKIGINAVFDTAGFLFILLLYSLVFGILVRACVRYRNFVDFLVFIGFLAFMAATVHDMYYLYIGVLPLVWFVSYGYLATLITMLGALIIHQRKAFDDLLFYKNELTVANRNVARESENRESFIQTVAHELRTPIHGMDAGLRMIQEHHDVPNGNELIASGIFNSFQRLKRTVQNIFCYVSVQRQTLRVVSHLFKFQDLISELHTHYSALADEKGIAFTILYGTPDMPEQFLGDREHIQIALANVMQNAVKYTDVGGVVCNVTYREGVLSCSISDTGCGMDKSIRDALFAAFQRTEEYTFSRRYEGVGLGLSITDSIVKALGGEIVLESGVGRGTSVILSFPLRKASPQEAFRFSDYTILVVDDNRVNCELLSMMIRKMGCSCVEAYNGEEAVLLQKKHRYDLILMDVQMPVMDGFSATRMIREFGHDTPIIAITANAEYIACMQAGMDDYLPKPVNYDHLKDILIRFLR